MKDLADAETYALWVLEFKESGDISWLELIIDNLETMRALTEKNVHCGHDIAGIREACIVPDKYNQAAHNERVGWLTSKIGFSLSGTDQAWQT